jgi:hypothetical protein
MSNKKIFNVGLDIDDTSFHGAGLNISTGEFIEFRCIPDKGALRKKLNNLFGDTYTIHVCLRGMLYWLLLVSVFT